MEVPKNISDWTLDVLVKIIDNGMFESDWFDYKEKLPNSKDPKSIFRLRKSVAAFANSGGGYILIGVSDDRSLSAIERMVGVDPLIEIPRDFGMLISCIEPSVAWEFKNPAISNGNGNLIHICYIKKSQRRPHCVGKIEEGLFYPKRTSRGSENMNPEEIRLQYLNYYEKRIKLQLLRVEIGSLANDAASMLIPAEHQLVTYTVHLLNLSVIDSVLADTYSVIVEDLQLINELTNLRSLARTLNSRIQHFVGQVSMPLSGKEIIIQKQNDLLSVEIPKIITKAGFVMDKLAKFLEQ